MKLHIGVFFYNQESYVSSFFEKMSELIKNIAGYDNVRISIFDDASTDNTANCIRHESAALQFPVELYLEDKNRGGKHRAQQFVSLLRDDEVIYMIAGDDKIIVDGFLQAFNYFKRYELDMLICNSMVEPNDINTLAHSKGWPYSLINQGGNKFIKFLKTYYPRPLLIQATLFRADVLKKVGAFTWRALLDDWPLFVKLFSHGGSFEYNPDLCISYYCLRKDSMSSCQERILSLVEEVSLELDLCQLWGPLSLVQFRRALVLFRDPGYPLLKKLELLIGSLRFWIGFCMEVGYKWRSTRQI